VSAREELLTTEQVMDRLLADKRLRRVASTCVLPAIRCGKEWRFRRSDLDEWIDQQRASFGLDDAS
jgi:excisionase family DNA binding protein